MGIVVGIYLVIGGLNTIRGLVFSGQKRYRNAENPFDQVLGLAIYRSSYTNGIIKRGRWLLLKLIIIPRFLLLWPGIFYLDIKHSANNSNFRRISALARSLPTSLLISVGYLVITLLLVISGLVGYGGEWGKILSTLVLTALAAELISYIALGADLPRIVRRYKINPYLHFSLIAAADYLILLFNSVLLEHQIDPNGLTIQTLLGEAAELSTFSRFLYTLSNFPKSPIGALIAACGLLYFASIVKLIFQFRQFKRQPDDYSALIYNAVGDGDFMTAERWLGKVAPGQLGNPVLIGPRIATHLGQNEYDAAYSLEELLFAMNSNGSNIGYSTRTPDDYLGNLIFTSILTMELDPRQYNQLVTYACGKGITDGCLVTILGGLVTNRRIKIEKIDDAEVLGITAARYPLTHTWLMWSLADNDEGELSALNYLVQCNLDLVTDRLFRHVVLIDMKEYHNFRIIEHIQGLLVELSSSENLPAWCRSSLASNIDRISRKAIVGSERRMKLDSARAKLLIGASKDELVAFEAISGAGQLVAKSR